MLAACAVAATLFAPPPLVLTVQALPHVPPVVVTDALEEAASVWKAAGVVLAWRIRDRSAGAFAGVPSTGAVAVRVVFEDGPVLMADQTGRIGWIVFEGTSEPIPEIHVSYSNALELLRLTLGRMRVRDMPALQTSSYLSRAIGRALAHEIGHYLLRSKAHSSSGLMKAVHSTTDLFASSRARFAVSEDEGRAALAELTHAGAVARR